MDNIKIKPIKRQDLDSLVPAFIRAFKEEPWLDDWPIEGAKERMAFYLDSPKFYGKYISQGPDIIGAILGNIVIQAEGYVFHLEEYYIDPSYQGQGFGRRLYDQMIKDMKDLGVIGVTYVTAYPSKAYDAYRSMGAWVMDGSVILGHSL